MTEYGQAVRSFSPSLRRLLLAVAIVAIVPFGLIPVLFNLYLLRLGFDPRWIGLFAGVGQLAWAAAALPSGWLGNRIGLRRGIQIGMFVYGVAVVLLLMVERLPHQQWAAWLFGGQIVLNVGYALATVNIPPYIMVVTGERERRHGFAFYAAMVPLAGFVGSVLAGVLPGLIAGRSGLTLADPAPFRLALWLGPLLCWLAILPLLGTELGRIAGHRADAADSSPAPVRLLIFWGILILFAAAGVGAVRTFFNVYLNVGLGTTPAAIGFIMGAAQLLPVAATLLLPVLMTRWGTAQTFIVGLVTLAVLLAVLALVPQAIVAGLAYMGCIAVFAANSTSRDVVGQELVTLRWRTTMQATSVIGTALGFAAAGLVGGILIQAAGFSALFFAASLSALVAATLLLGFVRVTHWRRAASASSGQ